MRGLTYLRGRQGKEAAAEFQRILDHRSLGAVRPLYAVSYVGLARAYALTGDAAKARAAYQDFFALWKRRRPRHPYPKRSECGVRETAVVHLYIFCRGLQRFAGYSDRPDSCRSLVAVDAVGGDLDFANATEGE